MLALAALLVVGVQAFSPGPIRWDSASAEQFVLAPGALRSGYVVPAQELRIWDVKSTLSSSDSPQFAPQPDGTIKWDARGLCIEASGGESGDAVRVNWCTGEPSQLWSFSSGDQVEKSQIQLKDTRMCMDVNGKDGGLNGARVELQKCDDATTRSWKFENPTAQSLPQNPAHSFLMRQLIMSISCMLGIGALSLLAWSWRWNRNMQLATMNKSSTSFHVDQGGVSLTAPLAAREELALSSPSLEDGMVPAAMVVSAEPPANVADIPYPPPKGGPFKSPRKPYPSQVKNTDNFRIAAALSGKFKEAAKRDGPKKKVAIIGGGLSGLACAKYLSDAGHEPIVLEARDILGGKVSAWKDKDGDWIETGLHIFFGAYPNMMNLFEELDIEERLQWKIHKMIFAMQELPGQFTTFDFPPGVPAPLNFGAAILSNQDMLSLFEKIQTAPALLPMLIEGQKFIDEQDELSVLEFMEKYGMPDRINKEVFISMAKALDFIDPDKLSMTVVLTAMNRFLNETDGLQMAFLDGNQTERLCEPMKQHIEARGGQVRTGSPVKEIVTAEDGTVSCLRMHDGSEVTADMYVSAMPVDVIKKMIPAKWSTYPYFGQLNELEGIPVINLHMWFDRKLQGVDHLTFSRSPLLSVYADMSTTCEEYYDKEKSMLELVFAPCSPLAGSDINWIGKSDEEIIDATMGELARLFPLEIANDPKWPATAQQGPAGEAKLVKHAVVRVPRSVYAATPGRNKYRPDQVSPIDNFVMAGDYTSQKFLGSMEGAVLGGKLAAEVIVDRALEGTQARTSTKPIQDHVIKSMEGATPKEPVGVSGKGPLAFGGGQMGLGDTKFEHP